MFNNKVLWGTLIALAILSGLFYREAWTGFGLAALLIAVTNFLVGIIILFTGNMKTALTFLFSAGLVLVIGFSVCSIAPIR